MLEFKHGRGSRLALIHVHLVIIVVYYYLVIDLYYMVKCSVSGDGVLASNQNHLNIPVSTHPSLVSNSSSPQFRLSN